MAPSAIPLASEGDLTTSDLKNTLSKATPPTAPIPSQQANGTHATSSPLDASLLESTYNTSTRAVPAPGSAAHASTSICTDHMITASWSLSHGWAAPKLIPYGPLSLMPTASVLHYATECFEGLKLYRGYDGKLRLFRPERNAKRMLISAARIALPAFDPHQLLLLIAKLCATDGAKWLPYDSATGAGAGQFLYLRPTMIADDAALGVQKPRSALLYVIMTCFARLDDVPGGMRLLASEEDTVRAWPGGFGYAKVGANYGPSLAAQGEARRRGFQQVLWLLRRDGDRGTAEASNGQLESRLEVTEAGASNFFIVWRSKIDGALELLTAPLGDRVILDGVTRRSVLELAAERLAVEGARSNGVTSAEHAGVERLRVLERKIYIDEIVEAASEGRLIEAFAAGTAFFVAPVGCVGFRGEEIKIPVGEDGAGGVYTRLVKSWLADIMYGRVQHEWGYVIDEE